MKIKPFKGIRPPKNLVEQVESRPYDVLDSEEARAEAGDNEKSLYHIIKPEIDFPVGTSEYDPRVYEKAAQNFQMFQDKGWLVQDEQEHRCMRPYRRLYGWSHQEARAHTSRQGRGPYEACACKQRQH